MSKTSYWLFLIVAVILEVAGTSIMKASQETWPLIGMLLMYLLLRFSYYCLAKSIVKLPLGVAYAFWEGFGLILITLISAFILAEPLGGERLFALTLVFVGTFLINRGTGHGHEPEAFRAGGV